MSDDHDDGERDASQGNGYNPPWFSVSDNEEEMEARQIAYDQGYFHTIGQLDGASRTIFPSESTSKFGGSYERDQIREDAYKSGYENGLESWDPFNLRGDSKGSDDNYAGPDDDEIDDGSVNPGYGGSGGSSFPRSGPSAYAGSATSGPTKKSKAKFILFSLLGFWLIASIIAVSKILEGQNVPAPIQDNIHVSEPIADDFEEVPATSVTVETIGVTLRKDGHWEPSEAQVTFDVDDRRYHGGHSVGLQFFANVRGAVPGSTEYSVDIYRNGEKVGYPYTCIKSSDDIIADHESRWLAHTENELIHCPLWDVRKASAVWSLKLLSNGVEIGEAQITVRKPEPTPDLDAVATPSEGPTVGASPDLPLKSDSSVENKGEASIGRDVSVTHRVPVQKAVKIAGDINSARDFPRDSRNLRIGNEVVVEMTVGTDGRARNCRVRKASPDPQADSITCRLAEDRFQFRPAIDTTGKPIESIYGWRQRWFYNAPP